MATINAVDILLDGIGFSSCNQGGKAPLVGDIGEEFSSLLSQAKEEGGDQANVELIPEMPLKIQDDFSFSCQSLLDDVCFDFQDLEIPEPLKDQEEIQNNMVNDQENLVVADDFPVSPAMLFYPDVISPYALGNFLKSNLREENVRVDGEKVVGEVDLEFASPDLEKSAIQEKISPLKKKDSLPIDSKVYVKSFEKAEIQGQGKESGFSFSKMPMSMIDVLQGEKSVESVTEFKDQMMISIPISVMAMPQKNEASVLEVAQVDVSSIEVIKTTKDTLEIQLFPESLGKVDVKLSFDQTSGHMKAVILPETIEGYKAILKDESKMHESIQSIIQKDNGACISLEMRVSEPKEADLNFSMENSGFSGNGQKNSQDQGNNKHHKHLFDSSFYAQSLQEELLDNNRRLDMAV